MKSDIAALPVAEEISRGERRKGRGRPTAGGDYVGRDGLIEVTRIILKTTAPAAVTRTMIAERAGVDPALIRYYFGTVSHLIAQVVVDTHRRIHQSLTDLIAAHSTLEWVHARVGAIVDMFIENPQHHALIKHVMYGPGSELEHAEWAVALKASVDHTAAQIEMGVEAGIFRRLDPRMLHLVIIGMGEFFGSNADIVADVFGRSDAVRSMRDRYVDFVVDLLFNGLRARD